MSAQPQTISNEVIEQAMALHRAGKLQEAEAIYRKILAQRPDHPGALNLLGVIAHQFGHNEAAVELVGRAIALAPESGDFYGNLAVSLISLNRFSEAVDICRRGLALSPQSSELHNNLGSALAQQPGGRGEAIECFRRAIALRPDSSQAHNNLGGALRESGQMDQAVAEFRRAVALNPDFAEAYHNLANTLAALGDLEDSAVAYQHAARLRPHSAEAWNNFANALHDLRRLEPAIAAYERAVLLEPTRGEIWSNFGNLYRDWGQFDKAIATFRRAIEVQPDLPEAHNNLGATLHQIGRLDEAIAAFNRAVDLRPDYAEAINNLGSIHDDLHQPDQATEFYQRALTANPKFSKALNNLGNDLSATGRISEALDAYQRAMALKPGDTDIAANYIYTLHSDPGATPAQILLEQKQFDARHVRPLAKFIQPHKNDRSPDRRLKIGYVSGDFRNHVVAANLFPILERHDRRLVEVFCYSNVARPDLITAKIQSHADVWRNIASLTVEQVAQLIGHDEIDILIDLSMHSAGNRLLVFARKPAPIQMTYLGYCGATGLSTMDYRFSDPYLDSNETEGSYTEKTLYLPNSYWCYRPGRDAPEPSASPVERNGYITFGCLNNFSKVSLPAQKLWAQILSEVKDSRLLIHSQPGKHLKEVKNRFEQWGIDPQRLEFVGKQPWEQYIRTYEQIDIALDPFPYGGGITTCDALWMGVPVVTLVGETSVGRAGKSILSNVGLKELIANTQQEYVDIAAKLAGDPGRLKELRSGLRRRMSDSPLMNAEKFTSDFETILRQAWRRWCAGD